MTGRILPPFNLNSAVNKEVSASLGSITSASVKMLVYSETVKCCQTSPPVSSSCSVGTLVVFSILEASSCVVIIQTPWITFLRPGTNSDVIGCEENEEEMKCGG